MSACKQRHEQRKVERRRRHPTSAIKHGAAALAAAAVIAAGTTAYADPVRYDNPPGPGHFDWAVPPGTEMLSVIDDVGGQPGTFGAHAAFRMRSYYGAIVQSDDPAPRSWLQFDPSIPGYCFLVGVGGGDLIPTAGTAFNPAAYVYSTYPSAPITTLLPEGQQTYLGVKFDLGGGYQYGWIGVVRTGFDLDAFAWGYETTPGVPIPAGIPEPGSLALLAFGALAVAGRRRA